MSGGIYTTLLSNSERVKMNHLSTDKLLAQATCAVLIDGEIAGTAWLLSNEGHLLTAGHVLGTDDALSEVQIKFADHIPQKAFLLYHCFVRKNAIDFAILQMANLPKECHPLPISLARSVTGTFRLHGYGVSLQARTAGDGQFVGSHGSESDFLFRLRSKELAEEGFSGGAVYSDDLKAVVAMQIEAGRSRIGPTSETVLAMPLYRIAQLWQPLNKLVLRERFWPESVGNRLRIPLQLPPRVDHFTNRETDMAQLREALQPGKVVTVCGLAGIGKSALAAEVVWQLAPGGKPPYAFPDGIIFHSFYNQPKAELALEEIARAFGEDPRQGTPATAAKRALAGRQALLLLDGAENADNLPAVLAVRGRCGVLVTSRQRKDAQAKRQDLSPLTMAEGVTLLKAWAGEYAADECVAKQICNLLGGLPLAVRLVGRYLAETEEDVADYLTWLSKTPLDALDQGQRREESVPLLLKKSLDQVSDSAQQALAVAGILALSLFEREVVAFGLNMSVSQVRPLLGELVNYGLLVRSKKRCQVSHALVHTYARQRLTVTDRVVEQLATYYDRFARQQSESGAWAQLDAERLHIMALLPQLMARKQWTAAGNLAGAIDRYLNMQGYWRERLTVLEVGLKAARALQNRRNEGAFLGYLGATYNALGQMEQARHFCEQALVIAREIGDRAGESDDLGYLGLTYHALGKIEQAIDFYQEARAIAGEIGDCHSEGVWLGHLGVAYRELGQPQKALDFLQQALAIVHESNDRHNKGTHLRRLGQVYFTLGQVELAIKYYEQAHAIFSEVGDRSGKGNSLNQLGEAYRAQGQVEQARLFFQQALDMARQIGDRSGEGDRLGHLGLAYRDLGEVDEAIRYFKEALAIAREIGQRSNEGVWLGQLGVSYQDLGQIEQAIEYCGKALTIAREIGYRGHEETWLGNLGNAYSAQGQLKQAIKHYEEALTIARQIGYRRHEGTWLGNLGNVYRAQGQIEQAIRHYQEALGIAREIGDSSGQGNSLNNLALAYTDLGQVELAKTYFKKSLQFL